MINQKNASVELKDLKQLYATLTGRFQQFLNIEYFGVDHLPYAIPAIITLIVFVVIPILVSFLYPFQFFQRYLSLFPLNWHFFHAFVDSFQGCYKDGTEPGIYDYRWFSALTLLIRPLLFVAYITTPSMMSCVYILIILVLSLIIMINVQPFKLTVRYPSNDPVFLVLLSLYFAAYIGRTIASMNDFYFTTITILQILTAVIPVFYITFLIIYWLCSRGYWISGNWL